MNITDEMVERAAKDIQEGVSDLATAEIDHDDYRTLIAIALDNEGANKIARAALTAALGDVEPITLPKHVMFEQMDDGVRWKWERDWDWKHAPDLDAAIRGAVANARGEVG